MFKFYSVKNNECFQFIGFHNHLLKIDIKTKDLLESLSSYTNLEKNVWKYNTTSNLFYTTGKNNKILYLTELICGHPQDKYDYKFINGDILDYRRTNLDFYDKKDNYYIFAYLDKNIKKIEQMLLKDYTIEAYLGGKTPKAGKDRNKLKNPIWIVRDKNDVNKTYGLMYCEPRILVKFSLDNLDKITAVSGVWYKMSNGYVATYLCQNGKNKRRLRYLHQLVANHYGHGKGQLSVDHINRNKLDNRTENLRIVSQSIQTKNCGKRRRKKNAQSLPKELAGIILPKFIYYCSEMIKRTDGTSYKRDFFRIEKHPNLTKKCLSSSKSMKKSILEKLEDIKDKLKMLG